MAHERGGAGSSDPALAGAAQADPRYVEGALVQGKYRLTRVLGKGGMGAVWLARNMVLDVDVAIKLIRKNAGTVEAASRLLNEARTAARLGHESIVRVFDFGETELGDPFIVMELLDGTSLRTVLHDRGRLDAEEAVRTLLPVASALEAAHAKGIVHRDLKPDNIVLVPDGPKKRTPKIVDFGIAKLRADDVERHVTQDGTVLGSPDYMSPEQALGKTDVDHRVDVWAFAVVLYESVTGHRPFDGPNYNALIASITKDAPPSILDFGTGDDELWAIVERGLAKDAADRWPAMRDFGRALGAWAVARGVQTDVTGSDVAGDWLADDAPNLPAIGGRGEVAVTTTTARRAARPTPGARLAPTPTTGRPLENGVSRPAGSRAPWAVAAIAVLGAIGVAVFVGARRDVLAPAPASTGVPSASSLAVPSPSASASATATATAAMTTEPETPPAVSSTPARPGVPAARTGRFPPARPKASQRDGGPTTPDVGF